MFRRMYVLCFFWFLLPNSLSAANDPKHWKLVSLPLASPSAMPEEETIAYQVRLEAWEPWLQSPRGQTSPWKGIQDSGGVMVVDARFRIPGTVERWVQEFTLTDAFLTRINRKTRFQALAGQSALFRGSSRQFLFDVSFLAEVRHLSKDPLVQALQTMGYPDLAALAPQTGILQEFRDYNRFLKGGESLLLFQGQPSGDTLVIVRSLSVTSKSVPGFIRGAMQGDIGDKLQHLAAQLAQVFPSR